MVGRLSLSGVCALSLLISSPLSAGTWEVQKDSLASILIGLDVVDPNIIYAAGGNNGVGPVIYKTIDGGRTWIQQLDSMQSASYLSIDAADSAHALAGGMGLYYAMAGSSYTSDGKNWRAGQNRWFAAAFQDADAVDSQHMFLTGMWATLRSSGEGVAASLDGGRTFNYFDWGTGTSARYSSFLSPTTGFLAGGQWPSDAKESGRLFRFSQGVTLPMEGPARTNYSYDGYRATVAKTINGGEAWEIVYDDFGRYYFNQTEFVDELNGWAVVEGDAGAWILRTTDGGYTWDEQHFQESGSLLALKMVNGLEGWAGGAEPTTTGFKTLLLHTQDGGETWQPFDTGMRYWIMNLDSLSDGQVWATAFGTNSMFSILKYTP